MKLIWVHHDCVHRNSPVYLAYPEAPSIFVWDDAQLVGAGWTMNRILFIYECLLDLPVAIRCGDPVLEVTRFSAEMRCAGIATMSSPDSHIRQQATLLQAETWDWDPFVKVNGSLDLRRFSRYWSKAGPGLLEDKS